MRGAILVTGLMLAGCGGDTETSTSMDPVPVIGEPSSSDVGAVPMTESPSQTTPVPGPSTPTDPNTQADPGASEVVVPESPPAQPPSEAEVESTPEVTPPESGPPPIDVESEPETPDGAEPNEAMDPGMNMDPDINTDPDMNGAEPEPETMDEPTETEPEDPVDEPPTAAPLSFATDIWPLWGMDRDPVFVYRGAGSYSGCADVGVCHGGETPGAQLSMADAETAYAQMIDTPSVSSLCAGTQRVAVGDPDNSCLILFYVGRLGKDDLDWVDDAEIELMREWIRQGALP